MKKYVLFILLSLTACTAVLAQAPVTPRPNQQALLKSSDPREAANKKLVFDFWRIILDAYRLEEIDKFVGADYIQHNPYVASGRDALIAFLKSRPKGEIKPMIKRPIVAITAEGDLVTLAFVVSESDPCVPGREYTTTQFDMFRIANGKIVEHWDDARLGVPIPGGTRPCLKPAGAPAPAAPRN